MLDFTFLTKKQVTGIKQLEILKKYSRKCAITDFAILLGGFVTGKHHTNDQSITRNRTGWWWTQTYNSQEDYAVYTSGACSIRNNNSWYIGARPATTYSEILKHTHYQLGTINGLKAIYCGEYPQWIVDELYSKDLEEAYNNKKMQLTGKYYTTNDDSTRLKQHFVEKKYPEYKYFGKKYIHITANPLFENTILSNEREIKKGEICWLRVEPIIWLIDEETNIALSKYILFAGLPLKYTNNNSVEFSKSDIKKFMDDCFSKEIIEESIEYKIIESASSDSQKISIIDNLLEKNLEEMNKANNTNTINKRYIKK